VAAPSVGAGAFADEVTGNFSDSTIDAA